MADFKIITKPVKIEFECPHCGEYVGISWREVDVPEYWGDEWPDVECPECGEYVPLEEWEII